MPFLMIEDGAWEEPPPDTVYRCEVWVTPCPGGGFNATPARLPGASAWGLTGEAAVAVALAHVEGFLRGRPGPPWTRVAPEPPPGARIKSVTVRR